MARLVWHYTALCRAFIILRDGHIRPADVGVGPGEQPVVWFTASPMRDPTISRQGDDRAFVERLFGPHALEPVRIGVPREITVPFARHVMPEANRAALVQIVREEGANPRDWYCHDGLVAASVFSAVEHDDGRRWRPATLADLVALLPPAALDLTVREGRSSRPETIAA
jgi:hypothetical protein